MSAERNKARRQFLKGGAALAGLAAGGAFLPASAQTVNDPDGTQAYGKRSHFETSIRIPAEDRFWIGPDGGQRMTPLQDSVGIITPASLHFISTHGYAPPDIDPREHRLMIHGMVDRPIVLTFEEIKRLPSVTRVHFIECAGNSALRHLKRQKPTVTRADFDRPGTIQELHGETSCSEWTGVELSMLLQQVGVRPGASWLLAEGVGADESKGRHIKSIPLAKAMDDALIVYGQNGEALRPENGYPLRLLVPGFEGVSNVKWIRRIKLVDTPYMTYDETTGYIARMPSLQGKTEWFQFQVGPKSIITYPSDAHKLSAHGFYEITGLAWSGAGTVRRVEVSTDGGRTWKDAKVQEPVHRKAYTRFRANWNWNGEEAVIQSRCTDDLGQIQPNIDEKAKEWGVERDWFFTPGSSSTHMNTIQPGKSTATGASTMRCLPKLAMVIAALGFCGAAHAQLPAYSNVGRTPSAEEVRAWDIAIGPEGKELPPGAGTAKEGAIIFAQKCAPCHGQNGQGGVNGVGGPPLFKSRIATVWPYATTLWDYVNRDMPWKQGQTLKPEEVYSLVALLLYKNGIIQETDSMDARSLPKVHMPNRDGFVPVHPAYKPDTPNQRP